MCGSSKRGEYQLGFGKQSVKIAPHNPQRSWLAVQDGRKRGQLVLKDTRQSPGSPGSRMKFLSLDQGSSVRKALPAMQGEIIA